MRRLALLLSLPVLLAACMEIRDQVLDFQDKPYATANSVWFVLPTALSTPPVSNILYGPCTAEFDMPESRRANCDLYHRVRGRSTPWAETAARAQTMAYGPGELQCWRTLGTSECIAIAGPPRPVNMVAPNMGAN
jgi:hypothetical protein